MRDRDPGRARLRRAAIGALTAAMFLCPRGGAATDRDEPGRTDFAVPALTSDWRILVGGNLTDFETSAAWAPRGLAGAAILLEDALGLDERISTIIVAVQYRINRRHCLGLTATGLGRSATRTIDSEIEWGDYVFRAAGTVATDLDTRIFKLTWRYDFSDMDRLNAGFLVGLSTFDLGITLAGEVRLESSDGDEWIEGAVEGESAVAPVPVVGFYLDDALSPRWMRRFSADVVDRSLSSHRGRVLEADFAFEFAVTGWFAVGTGLGSTDLEYRGQEKDETFAVRYRFNYLGAYASFAF
jgi:hypothetical protein